MQPILVINDSPEFLALMHDFLTEEGFAVELRASGKGVLELVGALRPALIILDLVLGEVDGWVVLAQLRADDVARAIPVILCTAAAERARDHEEALAAAGARVVEKPFDLDHMLGIIVEVIGSPEAAERPRREQAAAPRAADPV